MREVFARYPILSRSFLFKFILYVGKARQAQLFQSIVDRVSIFGIEIILKHSDTFVDASVLAVRVRS
jgi:hypothetical protein